MTKRDILQSDSMEENIKEIFMLFDEDKDGFISLNELNKVTNAFGEETDKQLKELFDSKVDKRINLEGRSFFVALLKEKLILIKIFLYFF